MTLSPGRQVLLSGLSEIAWQRQIIAWAHRAGWLVHHVHDSRFIELGTDTGMPDLVLAKAGEPLLIPELKRMGGRAPANQQRWITTLTASTGVWSGIWRPTMEEEVKAVLGVPS